jgi:hypothetical protein
MKSEAPPSAVSQAYSSVFTFFIKRTKTEPLKKDVQHTTFLMYKTYKNFLVKNKVENDST